MSGKKDFVDSTFRKKWDKEYYEQRAKDREAGLLGDDDPTVLERLKRQKGPDVDKLDTLKMRDQDLNLMSRVGKSNINSEVPLSQQAGLYCEKCDMSFKDSTSLLNHYTSKKHNRMEGNSMQVDKSSLSKVQERLKQKKEEMNATKKTTTPSISNIAERLKKKKEEQQNITTNKENDNNNNKTVNSNGNKEEEEDKQSKEVEKKTQEKKEDKQEETEKGKDTDKEEKKKTNKKADDSDNEDKHDNGDENNGDDGEVVEEEESDEMKQQLMAMGLPLDFGSSKKNR